MTIHDIKVALDALVLSGEGGLDREVESAFAADVMSDLLAFGKADSLLLTRMTSPQMIRTAELLDIAAIVLVRGHRPVGEVLTLADELKIPVLATRYVLFEAVGRLYGRGLRGLIEKVDSDQRNG